jgi:hypothetical protein
MKLLIQSCFCKSRSILLMLSVVCLFALSQEVLAQEPPPRPINVTVTTNLSFGAFYHGAVGGTITVNPNGSRLATGDVVLLILGYPFSAAVYRITGPPGTMVSLLNGPDVFLTGSRGGSLRLHIGSSDPASPFFTIPGPLLLNVGGTLTVRNTGLNPPGSYSGTFDITFVQE